MTVAYVDTSVLVALAFREPSAVGLRRRLARFDRVVSSVFSQAELASALARESVVLEASPLEGVHLIAAAEPLGAEIDEVLAAGYLRGADCWHLAVALHYAPNRDLAFVTLDKEQQAVAAALGLTT